MPAILEIFEERREVARRGNKWFWTSSGYPSVDVKLRSMSDNTYTIVDTTTSVARYEEASGRLGEKPRYRHYG